MSRLPSEHLSEHLILRHPGLFTALQPPGRVPHSKNGLQCLGLDQGSSYSSFFLLSFLMLVSHLSMGGCPYSELYPASTLCPCRSFFTQASLYTSIQVHYLSHSQHMAFKHLLLEALKSTKIIQTFSHTTTFSNSQSGTITKGFIFKKLIATFFTIKYFNSDYPALPEQALGGRADSGKVLKLSA